MQCFLKELYPNSDIVEGFSVSGTKAKNSDEDVKNWLKELDLK